MKTSILLLWGLAGIGTTWFFFITQYWSVKMIRPENSRQGKWLIVGGAALRWMVVFGVLASALSSSLTAMFVVFGSFMVSRLILLFIWHGSMFSREKELN